MFSDRRLNHPNSVAKLPTCMVLGRGRKPKNLQETTGFTSNVERTLADRYAKLRIEPMLKINRFILVI